MINLDYASHTQADEAVLAEFCKIERECAGNPLSAHQSGCEAREIYERATEGISALLCVNKSEIIYTSGASEANNLAVKGIARAYVHTGRHILSTCLEHPSVSGALTFLSENGYEIELLKILPNGKVDLSHLKTAIRNDTILLCVSAVDSELGAIQPMEEIAAIKADFPNCHLHIDAAQAVGKIPMPCVHASTFCFSPHKFHGLGGFGVLVKREGVVLEPLIHGGSESNGLLYRGGTPSPAMASACFAALQKALQNQHENFQHVTILRNYLLENLPKTMRINSPSDGSPYILNISAPNIKGKAFQTVLNERGIAVSVKSACSTDNAPSRPVFAVSGDKKNALNSWRVSFSNHTTMQELDTFLSAVREILKEYSH
ncbi:MAG: aminotransferase class V-fold PLP-dependent enzyme [Defluviitaleaceae bacterium]|nr:aminotransferase class V-fold PLP-dependent enzyme [Defluviitaleaceae bacterium]